MVIRPDELICVVIHRNSVSRASGAASRSKPLRRSVLRNSSKLSLLLRLLAAAPILLLERQLRLVVDDLHWLLHTPQTKAVRITGCLSDRCQARSNAATLSAVQTTKTLLDVDTLIGAPTGC